MLKQEIIEQLRKDGADIITFGNIERFRDKDIINSILPDTKTVICVAFRQLRGSRRGIEEGSTYYQYTTTAVETLEEVLMPYALHRGCGILEEHGYEAMPQKRCQLIMQSEDDTNFEMQHDAIYRGKIAEKQINFERCAQDAGLGEMSQIGTILTDDFGPFQRWAFIFTDAEIQPDPIIESHLCDKCNKCMESCPGAAFDENGNRNSWQCATYYQGANRSKNPFMPADAFDDDAEKLDIISGKAKLSPDRAKEIIDNIIFYPPMKNAYVASICGRACDTACYIHLEEKGVLKRKFKTPFRKRPEWKLSITDN